MSRREQEQKNQYWEIMEKLCWDKVLKGHNWLYYKLSMKVWPPLFGCPEGNRSRKISIGKLWRSSVEISSWKLTIGCNKLSTKVWPPLFGCPEGNRSRKISIGKLWRSSVEISSWKLTIGCNKLSMKVWPPLFGCPEGNRSRKISIGKLWRSSVEIRSWKVTIGCITNYLWRSDHHYLDVQKGTGAEK